MFSFHNKIGTVLIAVFLFVNSGSVLAQNINTPNKTGPLGTEVNTLTGNLYIPRSDIYIPARGFDINISFSYNSFNFDSNNGFGNGWGLNYDIRYTSDTANNKIIQWGNGRDDQYTLLNGAGYKSPAGYYNSFTQYQTGKFVLTELDGRKYYFDNSTHKKITRMEERNGNFINFNYTDTLLTSLVNNAGQSITFGYNTSGLLLTVTDAVASPSRSWSYMYDASGNLLKVTDPLGGANKYTYLVNGPMKTMSDKNDNTIDIIYYPDFTTSEIIGCNKRVSFTYDTTTKFTVVTDFVPTGSNQVTTYGYKVFNKLSWLSSLKSNCCGFNMTFEFDANGNKTKETDANGNISTYTYDSRGNMLTMTDALNQTVSYTYTNDYDNIKSFTDAKGFVTTMMYNGAGNLVQLINPGNLVYTATYNTNGDLIGSVDAKGNTYTYHYDAYGHPLNVTGPNGYNASLIFDARGRLLSYTDARGNTSSTEYDILDRVKKITDPINNTIQLSYDAIGNTTSVINQNNETTQLTYDASNRLVQLRDAINNNTNLRFDAMDNLVSTKNALGNNTSFSYDTRNRLVTVTDAQGNTRNIDYDNNGNVTRVASPNGQQLTYQYDALNRITSFSDTIGTIGSVVYDKNNNITSITNGTNATTTAAYDNLNRIKKITDPLGNSYLLTYDNNNNIASVTDRNGFTKTYTYDSSNRVKTFVDNSGFMITATHDQEGNLIAVKDQNNNITTYTYDKLNRMTKTTYADGKFTEFTYNNKGNIITKRSTDGTNITYTYDSLSRVTNKTLPDGQVYTYTYDALGRVITATNNAGTIAIGYDILNRITSETFDGRTTRYDYNIEGRTQTLVYPDSTIIVKYFDTRNRLTGISKNNDLLVSYSYNKQNQLTRKVFSNGIVTDIQFDFANRLSTINTASGNLQNTFFTYDNEGNKKTINRQQSPTLSEQFTYDNNYRVTNYKRGILGGVSSIDNTYYFDAVGNRTSTNLNSINTNYTINNLNQLTNNSQGIAYTYDNKGNLTYDGVFYKKYDAEHRLISDSAMPGKVLTYVYDAFGRRIQKITNGILLKYTYAGLSQIEERNGISNDIINSTIFNNFLTPVANKINGSTFYYHQNEMNSVEAITSISGNLVESYRYDLYGKQTVYNSANTLLGSSVAGNRFGFTGQEYDSTTGSYKFQFRNYSPTTGTFNQRDLIGYEDGMGMYQYVHNNPANGIDIFGLADCPEKDKKKLTETDGGPHPWWDYGTVTGMFGDITNAIGTATLPMALTDIPRISDLAKGATMLNNPILGKLLAVNNLLAFQSSLFDLAGSMGTNTAAQNVDGVGGVVANGVGAVGALDVLAGTVGATVSKSNLAVAGAYSLLNASIKAETHGEYGGIVEFNSAMYSKMFNNLAGNSEYIDHDMEYAAFKRYKEMDELEEQTLPENQRHFWLRKWFDIINKRKEKEQSRKPKPDCPQNQNPHGTQKPTHYRYNPVTGKLEIIQSNDPNEILGPDGVLTKKWVSVIDRLPYTILYENSRSASAPAKFVRIATPVEPKQDPATFELGSFGFNNLTFSVPNNTASYYQRLDLRDSLGLYVDVIAGYDQLNKQAFWQFQSIDPVTLVSTRDPLKGFLLLQDSANSLYGHGFVNFSMKPLKTSITLDTIGARASIVFDGNDTIPTNIHSNTIDAVAPTSHINDPIGNNGDAFMLTWSGADDTGGSGIDYYTVYASGDAINYSALIPKINRTDTTVLLKTDSSYCFFVLATDKAGNKELLRPNEIICRTRVVVLPINWLYFNGKTVVKDNILEWATASKKNNKQFDVERSLNGSTFVRIGIIKAAGISSQSTNYLYKDYNIDKLKSETMYYRLKQINIDGTFTYSNIVRLNYKLNSNVRSIVYPNPTEGSVTLFISDNALFGSEAGVYDINGKLLEKIKINSANQVVNLGKYLAATYLIKLSNGEVLKVIKH